MGVTSLQMDLKIDSASPFDIMKVGAGPGAAADAMHILNEMNKAMTGARTEVSGKFAPKIDLDEDPGRTRSVTSSARAAR